jgi:WD40 repeat protein
LSSSAKLWRVATGHELRSLEGWALAFSPDGKSLATAADNRVMLWDVDSGAKQQTLHQPAAEVSAVAFSADGTLLAAPCRDGTVHVWEVRPSVGRHQAFGPGVWAGPVQQVAFSPQGRYLATANGNGTVYIFRLAPPGAEKVGDGGQ